MVALSFFPPVICCMHANEMNAMHNYIFFGFLEYELL